MAERIANLEAQLATLTHTVTQLSKLVAADHQELVQKLKSVISAVPQTVPAVPSASPVPASPKVPQAVSSNSPVVPVVVPVSAPGTSVNHRWCYASYQAQATPASQPLVIASSHQVGMGRDDQHIQVLHEGMYALHINGLVKHSGVSSLAEITIMVNDKQYEVITVPLLGPVGSSYGIVSVCTLRHMQADDKITLVNGATALTVERLSLSVSKY